MGAVGKKNDRIIALQKQLKFARDALTAIAHGANRHEQCAENALEEMNKIEWASKPNLVQDNADRRRAMGWR